MNPPEEAAPTRPSMDPAKEWMLNPENWDEDGLPEYMFGPEEGDPDEYKELFARFLIRYERRNAEAEIAQPRVEDTQRRLYGSMFKNGDQYAPCSSGRLKWVVKDFLPETYLAILGGTSKAGKSSFATALAMAVCEGKPFLGRPTRPSAVLWCANEESEDERFQVLGRWPRIPCNLYTTHDRPLIDETEGQDALCHWLSWTGAKLVVIDPLYGATSAESLVDGRVARKALEGLKDICRRHRCAALVLHHFNKEHSAGLVRERFADSNQLLAVASMDILMDSAHLPDNGRLLKLIMRGRGAFANQTLHVHSPDLTRFEVADDPKALLAGEGRADARILDSLAPDREGSTAGEIARLLNLNVLSVRNRLSSLLNRNRIVVEGKLGRQAVYTTRPQPPP